ncbi:MAG: hypothetical protein QOK37_3726 [Thermoanaerobaculia bacterium]|jgi:hypothetical protein|nr:hypothetical protein [Thermoanaerobaculia bacterium]
MYAWPIQDCEERKLKRPVSRVVALVFATQLVVQTLALGSSRITCSPARVESTSELTIRIDGADAADLFVESPDSGEALYLAKGSGGILGLPYSRADLQRAELRLRVGNVTGIPFATKHHSTLIFKKSGTYTFSIASDDVTILDQCEVEFRLSLKNRLSGRLFDGVGDTPLSNAFVFALSSDRQTVLDWSRTSTTRGPTSGGWRLEKLPLISASVILVGFHPAVKMNMWIGSAQLDGTPHDLGIAWTKMGILSPDPGGSGKSPFALLSIAGWIASNSNSANANDEAVALADRLLAAIHQEH